jgi:diguanylate cyclase (GGDEF)-like protein
MPLSPLIFAPSLAGTALGISVAALAALRRSGPAWPYLALLGVTVAIWCFGQTFWILADTPAEALRVNQFQYIGVQFAPMMWLLVALAQTGRTHWLRPWRVGPLLVIPLLTLAFAFDYTPGTSNWLWTGFTVDHERSPVPQLTHGPWFRVFVIYNYLLFLTGCALLFSYYSQSPHYRRQLYVTSVLPLLLIIVNVLYITGNWPLPLDPTPLGFAIGFAVLGWSLLRHRLLELLPLGRHMAFDSLGQGALIVDGCERIVDVNAAGSRLLCSTPAQLLGAELGSVLPGLRLAAAGQAAELRLAAGGKSDMRLHVSEAPIRDRRGNVSGAVLTLHDVTREREAQETLLEVQRRLEEANLELERVAHTDMLTGLANRRLLLARLELEFSRARRHGLPLALLMIDLDAFKQINDTRGHLVGDAVLRTTGAELRALTRPEDIPARYGGEELALLLTDTGAEGARTAARRVWELLRAIEHEDPARGAFRVTCCIGVAMLRPDDANANELIARADAALYAAKAAGRDCVMLNIAAAMERHPPRVEQLAMA